MTLPALQEREQGPTVTDDLTSDDLRCDSFSPVVALDWLTAVSDPRVVAVVLARNALILEYWIKKDACKFREDLALHGVTATEDQARALLYAVAAWDEDREARRFHTWVDDDPPECAEDCSACHRPGQVCPDAPGDCDYCGEPDDLTATLTATVAAVVGKAL